MRFMFDERKSAQAAAYLANCGDGSINYMVLIKLLYLADRRTLDEIGLPITGDRYVVMPHGPVLSAVLDRINMGKPNGQLQPCAWYEFISEPEGYMVSAKSDDTDELSRYELAVLRETHEKYGRLNKWALRDLTHTLPEWHDPNGSSYSLHPDTILKAMGRSTEEIQRIREQAEELWWLKHLASPTT